MTTQHMSNTTTTYRAACTCGYKGRTFRDPNAADEAAENHAMKYDTFSGGKSDGRHHHTSVVEAK